MDPSIRTRPSFPLSLSHQEASISLLSLSIRGPTEWKPQSQKTSQSNHTRTTSLSNSMKPSHARGATQDGRVMVERADRMWSTGEGNGKPLQCSCLENPMNSMKRQNDRILKEELPRSVGAQYATGDQWKITPERMKGWSQSKNNTQFWMWLMIEARSDAVTSNIT